MLGHDIGMVQKLIDQQPSRNAASAQNAQHSEGTKEVQRTRKISQQKANRNQVKKHAEGARDSVMRSSALAIDVANWDFDRSKLHTTTPAPE